MMVQRWVQAPHNMQDGALCNNCEQLNVVNYYQEVSQLKLKWGSRAGKIRFSGARKSVLLKPSSGERCAPQNFVQLVTFRGTRVHLIMYLVVHQMKYLMER